MTTRPSSVLNPSGLPSFLEELAVGRLRWDLIYPFPVEDETSRKTGNEAVAELSALLLEGADPEEIDRSRLLPEPLISRLRQGGWFAMASEPDFGGRALSPYQVFRAIHAAASWSVTVAQVMAVQAAIGVGALVAAVDGPLADLLRARVAAGDLSGSADTEPSGAANQGRATTATPVDGGAAYLLNGEKIHIGNGPLAQTLIVSATALEGDGRTRRLFMVDTSSPGFRVHSQHEFMGLRGFPNAALTFTNVRVPRENMLVEADSDTRLTPKLLELVIAGRMYLIAAPSLAIARRCVEWMRTFAETRLIDGRPLAGYDEIQRQIADSLADTFAVDTVASWCLSTAPAARDARALNRLLEQMAAKNIASVTCWRVLDRTMSLLAGEGFETAASKAARGASPLPLERAYRDARGFRISGGVDFLLDYWGSAMCTLPLYLPEPANTAEIEAEPPDFSWCADTGLTPPNQAHLAEVGRQAHLFARTTLRCSRELPPRELADQQRRLILLNQILDELATSALVLARAGTKGACAERESDDVQRLADVACAAARLRLADYWNQLQAAPPTDHATLTARWMGRDGLGFLSSDLVGDDVSDGPRPAHLPSRDPE